MCGIFGAIHVSLTPEEAIYCVDKLTHRGPDDSGLWQEDDITMGHRRLSIMDTSTKGKQPMSFGDGRYVLVFNGEVYNFMEIRAELEAKGYRFTSECDSEVILAAYIEWQEKCISKFNGMWAMAIWDRVQRKLFLCRDRFGVKPLYYTYLSENHNSLAFASEMKALTPLMRELRPNYGIVTDPNRMVYYESTDECVIDGIYRLPAGCYAYLYTYKDGLQIRQYWNTLDNLITVPESYDEQVEMCRELFLDACKLRMRSDVTIGTALSGGLDSSATICAMSYLSNHEYDVRMNKDWQHAYVATFPGTTQDESEYARKVTDFLGINSTEVVIDPAKAIDKLEDYIYLFEDVYLTSPIPMMELYGALRQDGTLVTIDGHGADELFGGYTFDFVNALKDASTREEKDMILTAYIESFPKDDSNMSLKRPSAMGVYLDTFKKKLADKKNRKDQPYKIVRAENDERYQNMDTLGQILYVSSHETILPTLLRNYDRYSMANSVEIRMPFMDYRMVTLAMSLPWQSKLHGGYSKSIIRDAMAPYMPEEIAYRRTKIGFNSPMVEWMKGPMREYFMDMVSSEDFATCDLINPKVARSYVESVINDENATFAMGEKAFSAVYPYLWKKGFLNRA